MPKQRRWAEIYDDLLMYQADLSHDLEQMFFRTSSPWHNARHVLDFGAGNAYYAKLLSTINPEKNYFCVEVNPELSAIAERQISGHGLSVINGSFSTLGEGNKFDFVYCRHVLSYLKDDERQNFLAWLSRNTSSTAGILVIDAEDDAFYTYPRLPTLEGGNEKFKEELEQQGGDRSLYGNVAQQFNQYGFTHASTRSLIVHSAISGRKYLMAMFMKAVAEIDHGSPLPDEVRDEIDSWVVNRDSYLQYGVFGSLFVKG